MNRATLMEQIESKTGHPAAEIGEVLELVLQEIGSVLADGGSVSLGGYGIFVPHVLKKQREGQSGSTSWWREDTGRTTVLYKPGKDMLNLVRSKSVNRKANG